MTEEMGTQMGDGLNGDHSPNNIQEDTPENDQGDKFFITLTQEDQNKVLECLASGQFENPSDFIRNSIGLSHKNLEMTRDVNQKFRAGMTSLRERLERYQRD